MEKPLSHKLKTQTTNMYSKEFEIRWSDIDANRHLANSAYVNLMSHTRMGFMLENGFSEAELIKNNLGPVVFYEHIYYFKEIFIGQRIKVTLQLKGLSKDRKFFEFLHRFYNQSGENCASCEMLGSWIDLNTRKIVPLPGYLYQKLNGLEQTDDFRLLKKEDTRKFGVFPKDLQI